MRKYTLCFLCTPTGVWLARASERHVLPGRYNGYGGKWEHGETILEATVREVYEECGVRLKKAALRDAGQLYFWDECNEHIVIAGRCALFVAHNVRETPRATEEMLEPRHFPFHALPHDLAREGDSDWIRLLFNPNVYLVVHMRNGKTTFRALPKKAVRSTCCAAQSVPPA